MYLQRNQEYDIRRFLKDHLQNWSPDLCVVFKFGKNPSATETKEVLKRTHLKLDRQILRQKLRRSVMMPDERSEWVCLPEFGEFGLHYHALIKIKSKNLSLGALMEDSWLYETLTHELAKNRHQLTNKGTPICWIKEYPEDSNEQERTLNYWTKDIIQQWSEDTSVSSHKFDRLANIIFSKFDWQPSELRR